MRIGSIDAMWGLFTGKFNVASEGERLCRFEPKPDITPYELALIVKNLNGRLGGDFVIRDSDDVPANLMRHFVEAT